MSTQPAVRANSELVVVSFYCGGDYYREAADQLRQDCERVGLAHDIVEIEAAVAGDWIAACRRKIPFYPEMHRKHQRPILWLDVDSRLARLPDVLHGASCDIAGFVRGFRYLRDFDPVALPRFFAPFALYFNYTPRVTAFLELMAELERQHEGSATDDYFLHEAWLRHQEQLSVLVLPPDLIGHEWPLQDSQSIYVGISGNVSKYKDQAQQHTASLFEPSRRKAMLLHEAEDARRSGAIDEALMLYRRALAIAPDDALAQKILRLSRRQQAPSENETAESNHRTPNSGTSRTYTSARSWRQWLRRRPDR